MEGGRESVREGEGLREKRGQQRERTEKIEKGFKINCMYNTYMQLIFCVQMHINGDHS